MVLEEILTNVNTFVAPWLIGAGFAYGAAATYEQRSTFPDENPSRLERIGTAMVTAGCTAIPATITSMTIGGTTAQVVSSTVAAVVMGLFGQIAGFELWKVKYNRLFTKDEAREFELHTQRLREAAARAPEGLSEYIQQEYRPFAERIERRIAKSPRLTAEFREKSREIVFKAKDYGTYVRGLQALRVPGERGLAVMRTRFDNHDCALYLVHDASVLVYDVGREEVPDDDDDCSLVRQIQICCKRRTSPEQKVEDSSLVDLLLAEKTGFLIVVSDETSSLERKLAIGVYTYVGIQQEIARYEQQIPEPPTRTLH